MKGRYAGVSMSINGAILPGAARPSAGSGQALAGLEAVLQSWNRVYDTVRPHQALGYPSGLSPSALAPSGLSPSGRSLSEAKGRSLTPEDLYQHWLHNQLARKEALSDIPWSPHNSGLTAVAIGVRMSRKGVGALYDAMADRSPNRRRRWESRFPAPFSALLAHEHGSGRRL